MPPRKSKINKIVNEQAEQKIQSFVNKANSNECDNECDTSSEDDTNIYIKSIKNNITPPPHESEQAPPPPQAGLIKKSKAKPTRASRVIQPSPEISSPFMDERYLKLFSDYKNELAELKTIIPGTNQPQKPQPVLQSLPQGVVDTRREAMKLKFS